jgi:hypothetical protein
VIFKIVLNYFIVYEVYFIVSEFSRTIRVVYIYFVFYALFS